MLIIVETQVAGVLPNYSGGRSGRGHGFLHPTYGHNCVNRRRSDAVVLSDHLTVLGGHLVVCKCLHLWVLLVACCLLLVVLWL